MLRLPPDFADGYAQGSGRLTAFNVPLALALALAARPRTDGAALARRLMNAAAIDAELAAIVDQMLAAG